MAQQDMLGSGALAEVAVLFKDFAEKLGSPEGLMWLSAFKQFLRKENPWELVLGMEVERHDPGGPPDERWLTPNYAYPQVRRLLDRAVPRLCK